MPSEGLHDVRIHTSHVSHPCHEQPRLALPDASCWPSALVDPRSRQLGVHACAVRGWSRSASRRACQCAQWRGTSSVWATEGVHHGGHAVSAWRLRGPTRAQMMQALRRPWQCAITCVPRVRFYGSPHYHHRSAMPMSNVAVAHLFGERVTTCACGRCV